MTNSKNFCHYCYKEYMAAMYKKTHGDKNVFIDVSKMTFKCKIPKFTHDQYGRPIVVVLDCSKRMEITYSQEEWLRRRQAGEL
jgi:hypothetical protein